MVLAMDLIKPELGLFFWTLLTFLILLWVLKKFAWGPISEALDTRNQSIEDALKKAEQAKAEMASLESENERLLVEAREERARIIAEAKDQANSMVEKAKTTARDEANKEVEKGRAEVNTMKLAAMAQLKNEVGAIALAMSEKVLTRELDSDKKHQDFIKSEIEKANLT